MREDVRSKQLVSIVEVISEGEIAGLVNGYQSIYFDNTPIENVTRGRNFENVVLDQRNGRGDQSVMSQFGRTEKEINVGTELKHGIPLIRTITDSKVNRVRLTLGVMSLFKQEEDGSESIQSVEFKITVGERIEYLTITGKHHSQYLRNIVLTHLPTVPFTIKVERVQPDSDSLRLNNKTLWSSYTEIIDTAFAYPHTAVVGVKFDSQYFSNIPTRTYDVLGIKVKVPSNYDPIRRTYTGLWDGTFKMAWTNNPAWILYDLVTSKRYGLGQRLGEFGADKWALYQVAHYCDQMIPDGFGGKEPRFTCNVWLTEQRSAYEVINDICSIFRAMPVWNGTELTVIMDRPADPVWTYTQANVIGDFSRQYSAMKARHNAIQVEYLDAENNYEKAIEYVSDDEAIRKYGLNLKKVTAFGCTSRGQAHRTGLWILMTEKLETETITFTVGAEGLMHIPGDIIRVADSHYAGANLGGRVLAINGRTVTLDREINVSGNSYFQYINAEAKPVNIKISRVNGKTITLDREPTGLTLNGVWSLTTQQTTSQLYRAMTISENEDGSYTIMALQHEPQKEAIVDNGAVFEPRNTTLHRTPRLEHLDVQLEAGSAKLAWQTTSGIGTLSYDVRILKDGKLYTLHKGLTSLDLALDDLPDGEYEVVIIARNAQGQVVSEKTDTFVVDRPPTPEDVTISGGLTDITLMWKWQDDFTQTEIWANDYEDIITAKRIAKVLANSYTHTVGPRQTRYYWLRHTRGQNTGLFYEIGLSATTGVDIDEELRVLNEKLSENIIDKVFDVAAPARKLELVKTVENVPTEFVGYNTLYVTADGKQYTWNGSAYVGLVKATDVIPTSQLDTSLVQQLNQNTQAIGKESRDRQTALDAEARNRTLALQAEADNRTKAIQAEASNRTKALQAESAKLTKSIQDEARLRGTAITRLENVDKQQAQQMTQVTAKAEQAIAGFGQLQKSVANQTDALSEVSQTLTARLDNLKIGGTNLLFDSDYRSATKWDDRTRITQAEHARRQLTRIDVTETFSKWTSVGVRQANSHYKTVLKAGKPYVLSFYAQGTSGFRASQLNYLQLLRPRSEGGDFRLPKVPLTESLRERIVIPFIAPWSTHNAALLIGAIGEFSRNDWFAFHSVKLEEGTIATDWSPAPEDLETTVADISANLTAYQQTQATKENATTQQFTQMNTRLGNAEGNITSTQKSLSELNNATTIQLSNLTTRVGNAESSLNTIQLTKANKDEVATLAQQQLQSIWQADAKSAVETIQVGGRNLFLNSQKSRTERGTTHLAITQNIDYATLNQLVLSCDVKYTNARRATGANVKWFRVGAEIRFVYTDGTSQYFAIWKTLTTNPTDFEGRIVKKFTLAPNKTIRSIDSGKIQIWDIVADSIQVKNPKLEIGTLATDWSPAPEDLETTVADISANLTAYQQTQATKENATTQQFTQMNTRLGNAEGALTRLEQSRVTKEEVVSLARTGLQSEWRRDAQQLGNVEYANNSVNVDERTPLWFAQKPKGDYKMLVSASRIGIGNYGFVLVTTTNAYDTAPHVSQRAVASSSGIVWQRRGIDNTTWGDWIRQETTAGATEKAEAAKNAAIAEAKRLDGNLSAQITKVEQTLTNATNATAEKVETLSSSINNLSVGGRNLLRNSSTPYSSNGYSTRYPLTVAPEVGDDVVITLWGQLGEDRTGIGVYNSQGYNAIAELKKIAEGVYQGKGTWKKPMNGTAERTPNNTHLNVYFYPRAGTSTNTIQQIKLEKGTLATDWSPAPEDLETTLTDVRANITAASRAVSELAGKVSATHTIKAQAIAGGRTAIAGIALGATADNRTAESSVIVMADRFGVVKNAQDGTVKPMFNVTNNKVTLHGDLVADGSITATKLAADSVTTAALQAGAIRTEHLAAAQVSADKLAIGLGGNHIYNPIFANEGHGFSHHNGNYRDGRLSRHWIGPGTANWTLKNPISDVERIAKLVIEENITALKKQWVDVVRQKIRVTPGLSYIASVYSNAYRCNAYFFCQELHQHTGAYVRVTAGASVFGTVNGKTQTGDFENGVIEASRRYFKFVAPASGYIELIVRVVEMLGNNPDCYVARMQLEEVPATATHPSPWQNAGVTSIHGGSIVANSVTAQQIAANTITGNHLAANTIAAKHIQANSINARTHLQAKSIGADKLNVSSLSAVSAHLGNITSGHIKGTTIDGNTIKGGTIKGATIDGNTIKGGTIRGTTISASTIDGGVIKSARLESARGRFTGTLEVNQLLGSNILEVTRLNVQVGHEKRWEGGENVRYTTYRRTIRVAASPVERLLMVLNSNIYHVIPANQRRNIDYYSEETDANHPPLELGGNMITVMLIALTSQKTLS